MKKIIYLFTLVSFFMLTACYEKPASQQKAEKMVCGNTGEICLSDHSCCIVQQESVEQDHLDTEENTRTN